MDTLTVFISSAIGEFASERKTLKAVLERWKFVRAWVFEIETANSRPVVEDYLTRVAECDVYVLLLGKQLTKPVEAEYRTAVENKRPILAFIKDIPDRDTSAASLIKEFEATLAFKYARFDVAQDLEAKVVEAVGSTLLWRSKLTPQQTESIIDTVPPLSSEDRVAAAKTYLKEVVQRYQIWSTRYTLLAATARLRPERTSNLPAEFLPRGFEVLLREKVWSELRKPNEQVKTEKFEDLREAIEKHGDLILLGDPGSGKTTTLWRLMHDYAQSADSKLGETHIPVLIRLGRYDGKQAIAEFMRSELIESSKETEEHPSYPAHGRMAAHLQEYLENGRLLILFDALNEMPQSGFTESVGQLEKFRARFGSTRFVFTCRALDYTVKLDLSEAMIQDLDNKRIGIFLKKHWDNEGERLFTKLMDAHKDLLNIGRNPYMLLMIGQVYRLQGDLPSNRGLLFQSFVNALLEREHKIHPDHWFDAEIQTQVLSDLALAIQLEHGRGTSVPREWANKYLTGRVRLNGRKREYDTENLIYLTRSASLLDISTDGSLRFTHQLLQEYFTAVALLRLGVKDPRVRKAAHSYSWDEVLTLLSGLMENATPLVDLVMPIDCCLVAKFVRAALTVESSTVKELVVRLTEKLDSRFETECRAAARAIIDLETKADISHLRQRVESQGSGRKILSEEADYNFEEGVNGLIGCLQAPDWNKISIDALLILISDSNIESLCSLLWDEALYARNYNDQIYVELLGSLNPVAVIPQITPWLKEDFGSEKNDYLSRACNDVLSRLETNRKSLDMGGQERKGKPPYTAAIPHLIEMLRVGRPVAPYATSVLKSIVDEKALPFFAPLLFDNDQIVCNAAFEIIESVKRRLNLPKDYVIPSEGRQAESVKQ